MTFKVLVNPLPADSELFYAQNVSTLVCHDCVPSILLDIFAQLPEDVKHHVFHTFVLDVMGCILVCFLGHPEFEIRAIYT